MAATAVTPAGVRDGDPGALAGLCEVRGPAVLAYCEVVAGRGAAGCAAAAEAFGSFRTGVVVTGDLGSFNPEAMLISATRHAAARHAGDGLPAECARVPGLLAARADRSITLADHDWLGEHLSGCWTCRAPVARFEAADRAYLDPPATPLAPETTTAIVAAMIAAAPIRGDTTDSPAIAAVDSHRAAYEQPAQPANGHGAHAPEQGHPGYAQPPAQVGPAYAQAPEQVQPPHVDAAPSALAGLDQPTSAYTIPANELEAAPLNHPVEVDETARSRRTRRRDRPAKGAATGAAIGAPGSPAPAAAAEPRTTAGTNLPRPRRVVAAGPVAVRGNSKLRPAIVLPIAFVVLAVVAALAIAGVFGGGDPESAPQSFAPAATEPQDTSTTPVVVVPGAADVEREKARTRAQRRRAATNSSDGPKTTTTPAATTPPAAAAPPPPANQNAAAPPPPPPTPPTTKAKPTGKGSAAPGIDAGNGATGAESPAAGDTSTVPELAPPVVPVDPGG